MEQTLTPQPATILHGDERSKRNTAGLLAVALAMILAAAALGAVLITSSETRAELQGLKSEVAALRDQRTHASDSAPATAQLDALKSLAARLSELAVKLERPAAAIADRTDVPAEKSAPATGSTPDAQLVLTVREAVREELKAQVEKLRGQFGAFAGGAGAGFGGNRATPGGQGNAGAGTDMAASLREKAGLDEAKAKEISEMLAKTREEVRNLYRDNQGGGREQNQAKMQELQKKGEEELAKLLTPEQLAKVKELIQQGRNRGGRDQNRGGQDPDRPSSRDQPAKPPTAPEGQF